MVDPTTNLKQFGCDHVANGPEDAGAIVSHVRELIDEKESLRSAAKKALPELRCLYSQVTSTQIEDAPDCSVKRAVDALTAAMAGSDVVAVSPLQDRVREWCVACFSYATAGNKQIRNFRFLEEALAGRCKSPSF